MPHYFKAGAEVVEAKYSDTSTVRGRLTFGRSSHHRFGSLLKGNEDGLKRGWPGLPLPAAREALEGSAALAARSPGCSTA